MLVDVVVCNRQQRHPAGPGYCTLYAANNDVYNARVMHVMTSFEHCSRVSVSAYLVEA